MFFINERPLWPTPHGATEKTQSGARAWGRAAGCPAAPRLLDYTHTQHGQRHPSSQGKKAGRASGRAQREKLSVFEKVILFPCSAGPSLLKTGQGAGTVGRARGKGEGGGRSGTGGGRGQEGAHAPGRARQGRREGLFFGGKGGEGGRPAPPPPRYWESLARTRRAARAVPPPPLSNTHKQPHLVQARAHARPAPSHPPIATSKPPLSPSPAQPRRENKRAPRAPTVDALS